MGGDEGRIRTCKSYIGDRISFVDCTKDKAIHIVEQWLPEFVALTSATA